MCRVNADAIKGFYNALMVLSAVYSSLNPLTKLSLSIAANSKAHLPQVDARNPEAFNFMNQFIPDVIPLALDRLSSTALATDLDFHIDVVLVLIQLHTIVCLI